MKTLLVYYSFTQNNELLAKTIQTRLGCEMLKIETIRKRSTFSIFLDRIFGRKPSIRKYNLSMMEYDQFVFVGPIWMGQIASPLKTFLYQERDVIKRYSFITLCGGLPGQKEKIEAELTSIVQMHPENVTELWISDIVSASVTKDAKNISAYRIGPEEMEKFTTKIDEFCFSILDKKVLA